MPQKKNQKKSTGSKTAVSLSGDQVLVPRVLPRGTNSLPRDVVLLSQRSRLIEATALSIAEKGYADTAVADIISRAGVSRTTFYQQFKDKEDCFLFCFDQLTQTHLEGVLEALKMPLPPQHRLHRALEAYLARLAEDGIFTVAFFAEAINGGERVQKSLNRSKGILIESTQSWYRSVQSERSDLPDLPEVVFQLIHEGILSVLIQQIRSGHSNQLIELTPSIAYFMLSSLGLHEWANAALSGDIFETT